MLVACRHRGTSSPTTAEPQTLGEDDAGGAFFGGATPARVGLAAGCREHVDGDTTGLRVFHGGELAFQEAIITGLT